MVMKIFAYYENPTPDDGFLCFLNFESLFFFLSRQAGNGLVPGDEPFSVVKYPEVMKEMEEFVPFETVFLMFWFSEPDMLID